MTDAARPAAAIRLAGTEDLPAMADIERQQGGSWNEASMAPYCHQQGSRHALVAPAGAAVCGLVLYTTVLDEATIDNIVVRAQSRRSGVGRNLLVAAINQMALQGVCRCMLEVRRSNLPALGLYREQGFVEDGVRIGYYPASGGREDALLMSRRL